MTTTPTLDAAIRASCVADTTAGGNACDFPSARCDRFCRDHVAVCQAFAGSLATPTQEVIEAMARAHCHADQHPQHECGYPVCGELCNVKITKARAAHAALWATILGDELRALPNTQGVEP
jgi:hypothetical protein